MTDNPFYLAPKKAKLIEVWLGKPNEMESEFILRIDESYLPQLIAVLRRAQHR